MRVFPCIIFYVAQIRRYLAEVENSLYSLAWISLQDDGSVSLGLSDRFFTTIPIDGKNFLFNYYNRVTTEFILFDDKSPKSTLKSPHITFHPSIYFHLTDDTKKERWAGIADVDLILLQEPVFSWIRLVTRPINQLPRFTPRKNNLKDLHITTKLSNGDISLGLGVDIVSKNLNFSDEHLIDQFEWRSRKFIVFTKLLPKQKPTIAWYHQH